MNGCTPCEMDFDTYAPLTVTVVKSGGKLLVYTRNNGRNILIINRILLCREYAWGRSVNYLRVNNFVVGGDRLEQGLTHLKVKMSVGGVVSARAEAEYYEVSGRSVSCEADLS